MEAAQELPWNERRSAAYKLKLEELLDDRDERHFGVLSEQKQCSENGCCEARGIGKNIAIIICLLKKNILNNTQ